MNMPKRAARHQVMRRSRSWVDSGRTSGCTRASVGAGAGGGGGGTEAGGAAALMGAGAGGAAGGVEAQDASNESETDDAIAVARNPRVMSSSPPKWSLPPARILIEPAWAREGLGVGLNERSDS